MNKIKRIIILVMIFLMILICRIYATDISLTLNGNSEAKAGETNVMTLKLVSQTDTIGVVAGKIEYNSNISGISVTGKNGWTITHNPDNGEFNALKAAGAKNEEIMEISYTIKVDATGSANITIGALELATINYETKNVSDISKEITIVSKEQSKKTLSKIEITTKPTKTEYKEGEKFETSGMVVTAHYSDGTSKEISDYTYKPNGTLKISDKKVTISYTEDGITKIVEQKITVTEVKNTEEKTENKTEDTDKETQGKKDNYKTQSSTSLPYTGMIGYTIIGIVCLIIIGLISYKKYKEYKDI